MSIYYGSRYERATLTTVPDIRRGNTLTTLRTSVSTGSPAQAVVVRDGDRLDQIATTYLHDSELWWAIADLNPQVFDADPMPAGTVLWIPDVRTLS